MLTLSSNLVPLKSKVRELEDQLKDSKSIKLALDRCTANIMMADADFNIIYVNEALNVFLKEAEKDIQKDLPNFNVSNLLSVNIDIFH